MRESSGFIFVLSNTQKLIVYAFSQNIFKFQNEVSEMVQCIYIYISSGSMSNIAMVQVRPLFHLSKYRLQVLFGSRNFKISRAPCTSVPLSVYVICILQSFSLPQICSYPPKIWQKDQNLLRARQEMKMGKGRSENIHAFIIYVKLGCLQFQKQTIGNYCLLSIYTYYSRYNDKYLTVHSIPTDVM